mgnify:CR=1 FL=1
MNLQIIQELQKKDIENFVNLRTVKILKEVCKFKKEKREIKKQERQEWKKAKRF